MSHDRSLTGSFLYGIVTTFIAFFGFAALVVVELIATMLIYLYLALYSREWFGYLIGHSRNALNFLIDHMTYFFPDSVNAAYATVAGELAPKAMLLLIIGLVVGAAVRFVIWVVMRMVRALAHA